MYFNNLQALTRELKYDSNKLLSYSLQCRLLIVAISQLKCHLNIITRRQHAVGPKVAEEKSDVAFVFFDNVSEWKRFCM